MLLTLFIAPLAQAESYYVIDKLIITMRTGQGVQYQIIKTLESGDKIELLEEANANNTTYAKIRTEDGVEGWVLRRYIDTSPVASQKLAFANKKLERLITENSQLKEKNQSLKSEKANIESVRAKLSAENDGLSRKLRGIRRATKRPMELYEENKKLKTQLNTRENELKILREETKELSNRSQREWFIIGAVVVIVSILFGIILTRVRWRQRDNWKDSF